MPLNGRDAEHLAYWYFRLNGFFTIRDFIVHPDFGSNQQTDIDIFGVRFPHRSELLKNSMQDDEKLINNSKIHVAIVEVKAGICNINETWKDPRLMNIKRFLKALGALPSSEIEKAAQDLYNKMIYSSGEVIIEIILVGDQINNMLKASHQELKQITFNDILEFIYKRFYEYRLQKRDHSQWDGFGKKLWDNFEQSKDKQNFKNKIIGNN